MSVNRSLVRDLSQQDQTFGPAFPILRDAISSRAFPSASVAVTHGGRLIALKTFGQFVYETDRGGASPLPPSLRQGADFDVTPSTLFDLASVTKAVATTTMSAILYERGLLELDAPIAGTVPEFFSDHASADPRRRTVTFRMLLAHSSGLPAYEKLFLRCHGREELLQAAFSTPLACDPGTRAEYSDIGFIILGVALERIARETLDSFCPREIFAPLGMAHTTFNPPLAVRSKIPPTADERAGAPVHPTQDSYPVPHASHIANGNRVRSTFRNRIIQGEVQDENAFVLGGLGGHAGLFSPAEDLARFAHGWLSEGNQILRPETIRLFTQRQPVPANTSRALGWDTPSTPSQSGKFFGLRSFGHLGYTGTSLWIDPDRQLSITLLTNRTWPDCSNQAIKQVRPTFHDAIIQTLQDR